MFVGTIFFHNQKLVNSRTFLKNLLELSEGGIQILTLRSMASSSVGKGMKPKYGLSICWLRNDLRYHDNEVLLWAHDNSEHVLPVYCFDPRHYKGTYTYHFPKTGPFRAKFLLESVQDLSENLGKRGSKLIACLGKPEEVLEDLIAQVKVDVIVYQKEVTKEETDVEAAVEKLAKLHSVKVVHLWGSTLYHEDDLPFRIRDIPDTYTAFRKAVETSSKIRIVKPMPEVLKPPPTQDLKMVKYEVVTSLKQLGLEEPVLDPNTAFPFKGGETEGLKRVNSYLWETKAIERYKETRNGLLGTEYSTKFSSWLAFGCLSPRYIYAQIRKYEKERVKNDSTYWVIFELIWRDYFRFVCYKYGNLVFYPGGIMQKKVKWDKNMENFRKWTEGRTGVPFVDANMRELLKSGWMSNRGRQNVASFLTKDLKLDWRLGAEWFEYLLIDYDVCSNYGNWNYAAGIGNDPREDRKFNMVKQGTDYDPEGHYIRAWVPELAKIPGSKINIPWTLRKPELNGIELGVDYPLPIVVAPEWTRHFDKTKNPRWTEHRQKNQRGVDFYFKNSTARK